MEMTDEIRKRLHEQLTARPANPGDAKARDYRYFTHTSTALTVDVEDIPEATENLRRHGCMVDYDSETGAPIITSARQYREVCNHQYSVAY